MTCCCRSRCCSAAVLVGIAWSRLIETPVLRLRERLFPRRISAITEEEAGDGRAPNRQPAPFDRAAEAVGDRRNG